MGPEELQPHFEALVNERLNAIPITSNEDFKTTIVALRALGGGKSPRILSRMVPAARGQARFDKPRDRLSFFTIRRKNPAGGRRRQGFVGQFTPVCA